MVDRNNASRMIGASEEGLLSYNCRVCSAWTVPLYSVLECGPDGRFESKHRQVLTFLVLASQLEVSAERNRLTTVIKNDQYTNIRHLGWDIIDFPLQIFTDMKHEQIVLTPTLIVG